MCSPGHQSACVCVQFCAHIILFPYTALSASEHIGKSPAAKDAKEVQKFMYPHKNTLRSNLSCVWPNIRVKEGRTSRCFLSSHSTDQTFLVTLLFLCPTSQLRLKKEGEKLTNLQATHVHCCLYWTPRHV